MVMTDTCVALGARSTALTGTLHYRPAPSRCASGQLFLISGGFNPRLRRDFRWDPARRGFSLAFVRVGWVAQVEPISGVRPIDRPGTLLDYMGEFVGERGPSRVISRRKVSPAEHDVVANGVGLGRNSRGWIGRLGVVMNPYPGEVSTHCVLQVGTNAGWDRLARVVPDHFNDALERMIEVGSPARVSRTFGGWYFMADRTQDGPLHHWTTSRRSA
jgi:hypothetical protein